MNKPIHQKILEIITWLLVGVFALGSFLDGIANAITVINFKLAVWVTAFLLVSYLFLLILFKKRKVKWADDQGQILAIKKLSKRINWAILGMLLLLWLPVALDALKPPAKIPAAFSLKEIKKPVFDTADTRFKILVLPFEKECDFQGIKYDIGRIICRRLESLGKEDTIALTTHYLTDSLDLANFDADKADSLMKYHHADQILYGFYSLKQCEGNGLDKICFNYCTDRTKWSLPQKQASAAYNMVNMPTLESLRKGTAQEDIDYVIYWVAGISAMHEKKVHRALRLFQKIKYAEKYEDVQSGIGVCYLLLNDYSKAKMCLDRVVKINQDNDIAWNNLAVAYQGLNNYLMAKQCFEKAVKINPGNDINWDNLGMIYYVLKDYSRSKECYEKGLKINNNSGIIWSNLGWLYFTLKDYPESIECYKKALAIAPGDVRVLYNLGNAYSTLNDYLKAKEYYEKALKLDLNDAELLTNLGICYAKLNDYQKAIDSYEKALGIDSTKDLALANLGNLCARLEDYSKAKGYYERALEINPGNDETLYNLGVLYLRSNDYTRAKEYFLNTLKIDPHKRDALYNLAVVHSIQNDKRMTILYLRKAIVIDSSIKSIARTEKAFEGLLKDKQFMAIIQ